MRCSLLLCTLCLLVVHASRRDGNYRSCRELEAKLDDDAHLATLGCDDASGTAGGFDGDGDGRKDIWTNKLDVFASIVNYLRKVGWRPGMRWGDEVSSGAQAGGGGRIVRPTGAGGPAYQTTENFKVILRWNQSDFFALAVGLLSDRIAA